MNNEQVFAATLTGSPPAPPCVEDTLLTQARYSVLEVTERLAAFEAELRSVADRVHGGVPELGGSAKEKADSPPGEMGQLQSALASLADRSLTLGHAMSRLTSGL